MQKRLDESANQCKERRQLKDISQLFEDGVEIDRALRRAVRDALRDHKAAGNPVAVWQGGRVVWIPPEELQIPPEE